jgi:MFS family permease
MESTQQESHHPQKLWTKSFLLFTLSNLFLYMNLQMITPALPTYVSTKFGSSSVMISFVISAFAITSLLSRIFVGGLMERANKKTLLFWGLLIFTASSMGYYFAGSVAIIVLVRMLAGIGFGMTSTTYGTMVSDIVPAKRMGEGIGYFGLSTSLSMSLAPVLGLYLLNQFSPLMLIGVATLLLVIIFPLTLMIKTPLKRVKPQAEKNAPAAEKKLDLMDKKLLVPCGLNLLLSVTYGGVISFITLFGKEIHIANVGWFFLCNALMVVLVRPFSGKLFDTRGHAAVLPFGSIMVVIGLLLLSFANSMPSLIASALCYGVGFGTLQPALQAWSIQSVAPHRRGMANGVFLNSIDLGIALGSICLGLIATATSYAAVYRVSSLFMVLFIAIYGLYLLLKMRHMQAAKHL